VSHCGSSIVDWRLTDCRSSIADRRIDDWRLAVDGLTKGDWRSTDWATAEFELVLTSQSEAAIRINLQSSFGNPLIVDPRSTIDD
jgi:hypothetical protein